ncbi:hypothetical protein TWF694_004495 [Orbilia ellipsospora]|uniref:BTB domain-containing protein n=1 Tax=Orbilia ellipsospora TaxID=2528407 RepID=A0AAV9WWQ3_9PEZI
MTFSAPQYIPDKTDITLLLGLNETKFEANCNILASQSKFFETACYTGEFKEGKEKLIKLPDIPLDIMMKVLAWLYRSEPELPDDFASSRESTGTILEILGAADYLQIDNLAKDYAQHFARKLKQITTFDATTISNCIKIMNSLYKAGGSIKKNELLEFLQAMGSKGRTLLLDSCYSIEEPDGRFFQDLSYAILAVHN